MAREGAPGCLNNQTKARCKAGFSFAPPSDAPNFTLVSDALTEAFRKVDLSQVPSPCHVLHRGLLEQNLRILRSAGSLARVIGPVTAALLYFHFGSHFWVYIGGALLMLPAIWVVRGLPDPESERLKA